MTIDYRYTAISRAKNEVYWCGADYMNAIKDSTDIEEAFNSNPTATTKEIATKLGITTNKVNKYFRNSSRYELVEHREGATRGRVYNVKSIKNQQSGLNFQSCPDEGDSKNSPEQTKPQGEV